MLSLHSGPISFSRLSMSSSSTWSYSLMAFPLSLVMYFFMAWPNFTARDGIPTNFADDSSKLQISPSINFSPLVSSRTPLWRDHLTSPSSYQLAGVFAKKFCILGGVSKLFHLIAVTIDRFSHCEVKSRKTMRPVKQKQDKNTYKQQTQDSKQKQLHKIIIIWNKIH